VPQPPWHFSADFVAVDFRAEPDRVAELLPAGLEPAGDGSASIVAGTWSSAADADPRWREDPGRSQYHEAYLVVYATHDGRRVGNVPYIWVDRELSLVRGLIQGFPKRIGEVAVSRPVALGHGGPRRAPGGRFHATVSSGGERVLELSVTLEAEAADGALPPAVTTPLLHARWWPSLAHGDPEIDDLARNRVSAFELAEVHRGAATVELRAARFEEIDRLAPIEVVCGWAAALAFTIDGGTTIPAAS
jgi:acetoacetate decarboxylase